MSKYADTSTERLLISSCLIGSCCKYNGAANTLSKETLSVLKQHYRLVPVCPEVAGGLPVPRVPAERRGERIITAAGSDVTEAYSKGAKTALRLAQKFGCCAALLKHRSPSCGNSMIYDGSFSSTVIKGRGVAAEILMKEGIPVYNENELHEILPEEKEITLDEILAVCDHTLLRVDCTSEEIKALCDQGIKFHCASVCIPPCHVAGAKRYVGDKLKICTVIGFPNGYMTSAAKAFEAADAVKNGADEVDMVINLSMVKDGCWQDVANDIKAVREASKGVLLKVIIECCLLTEEEKIRLCEIVSDSGAEFIKTSTGFSKGGATFADVKLMREHCAPQVQVKAAGGISSLDDAREFMRLGATRLGTSRIVKIAINQETEKTEY
jgi:deoxyribose-phosphate aldolase